MIIGELLISNGDSARAQSIDQLTGSRVETELIRGAAIDEYAVELGGAACLSLDDSDGIVCEPAFPDPRPKLSGLRVEGQVEADLLLGIGRVRGRHAQHIDDRVVG